MNILHTKYLLVASLLVLLSGCYDDEGGNDYDSPLPDVSITIPEIAYSGSLGDTITIDPIITTDIDEADLEYHWEVNGARYNSYSRKFFASLVDSDKQAKKLNYVCHLDSNITNLSTSYDCRLRVHQKSTGRDFYPEATFTITIEGITGLMVLYGDDTYSDVGMLMADEFMPESSSLPDEPKATMGLYSTNEGSQIDGKGKSIVQYTNEYIQWFGDEAKNRCRISVLTDKDALWLNRNDLSRWGSWDDAFYLQGERKLNDNDPQGLVVADQNTYAFDGDKMFATQTSSVFQFLLPVFTPTTECADGNFFTLQPHVLYFNSGSGIQVLYYADAVNGDSSIKGFVGSTVSLESTASDASLINTGSDQVAFNPGNLNADLVKMAADSREHVLAVLKGTATNATYPGQYFFVDMYPTAAAGGNSSYMNIPQFIASMNAMPNVSQALAFDFGSTINMCYYATASTVYRYAIDNNSLIAAVPLLMTDGTSITLDGEVTMMKMLASPNVTTHFSDEILLVATWDGSQSHLYTFHLDSMTGNVKQSVVYDAETVANWNFGKIYDVNIKSL